ncbi:hypothetical protein A3726_09260 [Erythrobacter sp. HI0037]|nr:hypothetical protein A3719_09710 [Erythrobacter sp. HI0020]KZY18073.1 hypothetical protein A3726_09260 [Erythrobacter sp. HI0037]KZY21532.1 hypothetical protein A3727_23060 [Erythrobacter sp. HI0038]KZY22001.1 hypothetical protein A3727_12385 [Erythrobacter sp. HI0038]
MAADGQGLAGLWDDIKRRTTKPKEHATFVFYFLGAILFIGGLGIWVELINAAGSWTETDLVALRTALTTFFIALIASSGFQLVLGEWKQLRAAAYMVSLLMAGLGIWLIADRELDLKVAIPLSVIGYLISLWIWWISNADNTDLHDEPPPEASVGGELDRDLKGDLEGFDT